MDYKRNSPTSFVGEAIAHGAHMVADGGPFAATDDANVLDGQDGEEQVLVGPVVPVLVHGDSDSGSIRIQ